MIKGLGGFSFGVFLVICAAIGEFGNGPALWFLSFLLVFSGTLAFALFLFPESLEGNLAIIRSNANRSIKTVVKNFEDASALIRKDGLLATEGLRKEVHDPWVRYSLKKMMDGFEKNMIIQAIRNEHLRSHEQFLTLEKYKEKVNSMITLVGVAGTVCHIMYFLKNETGSVDAAFVPFLLSIFIQVLVGPLVQQRIDYLADQSRLYYAILEGGISGLSDGLNSEVLRDQLLVRLGERKWEA